MEYIQTTNGKDILWDPETRRYCVRVNDTIVGTYVLMINAVVHCMDSNEKGELV